VFFGRCSPDLARKATDLGLSYYLGVLLLFLFDLFEVELFLGLLPLLFLLHLLLQELGVEAQLILTVHHHLCWCRVLLLLLLHETSPALWAGLGPRDLGA
jgi:hypothetical protein